MDRSSRNQKALGGASRNASKALQALHQKAYDHVPKLERSAWAMAAVIHCDLCRLVVSLDECEPGLASLLSMADIVSKLYEAKNWYFVAGAKALRKIANGKACGTTFVDERLKELKSLHQIGKVEKYAVYRNKVGYHYDAATPEHLLQFGHESSENFYALLTTFVQFSGEWAKLTKAVIQSAPAE